MTNRIIEEYASEGLRTLLLAEKVISKTEYRAWSRRWVEASVALGDRDHQMALVAEELETGFSLVGATAIEDKLQDSVPQTISDLKETGMRIWVLTGDKIETAINIGFACKLLSSEMDQFVVDAGDEVSVEQQLQAIRHAQREG